MLPATVLADVVVVIPSGDDGDTTMEVNPGGGGDVVVVVPDEDGGKATVVVDPDEEEPLEIGDTVKFAGYEWYIIGTETQGVTTPEGCYTLFAKNNDFGSTTFRAGEEGSRYSTLAAEYSGSDLQKAMEKIADSFSEAEKAYIVARDLDEDDDIWGDPVENQLLWSIGQAEASGIDSSILQFDVIYWGRTGVCTKSF